MAKEMERPSNIALRYRADVVDARPFDRNIPEDAMLFRDLEKSLNRDWKKYPVPTIDELRLVTKKPESLIVVSGFFPANERPASAAGIAASVYVAQNVEEKGDGSLIAHDDVLLSAHAAIQNSVPAPSDGQLIETRRSDRPEENGNFGRRRRMSSKEVKRTKLWTAVQGRARAHKQAGGKNATPADELEWFAEESGVKPAFEYFKRLGVDPEGATIQLVRYGKPVETDASLHLHKDPPPHITMLVSTGTVRYLFYSNMDDDYKKGDIGYVYMLTLHAGDLLIMPAEFNTYWYHAVVRCDDGRCVFSLQMKRLIAGSYLAFIVHAYLLVYMPALDAESYDMDTLSESAQQFITAYISKFDKFDGYGKNKHRNDGAGGGAASANSTKQKYRPPQARDSRNGYDTSKLRGDGAASTNRRRGGGAASSANSTKQKYRPPQARWQRFD